MKNQRSSVLKRLLCVMGVFIPILGVGVFLWPFDGERGVPSPETSVSIAWDQKKEVLQKKSREKPDRLNAKPLSQTHTQNSLSGVQSHASKVSDSKVSDSKTPGGSSALPIQAEKKNHPRIALVVQNLGLNPQETQKAIAELSPAITLVFLPYTVSLKDMLSHAQAKGHETLLALPMEPLDYPRNDPGSLTLLTGVPASENVTHLKTLLSKAPTCMGVCPYFGSRLTGVRQDLKPILKVLKEQNLMILETKDNSRSQVALLSRTLGIVYEKIDKVISLRDSHETFIHKMEGLMNLAEKKGKAVGGLELSPHRLEQLLAWERSLDPKAFALVPLSQVASPLLSSSRTP